MQHNDCLQKPIQTLTEYFLCKVNIRELFIFKVGFIAGQWNKVQYYKLKYAQ